MMSLEIGYSNIILSQIFYVIDSKNSWSMYATKQLWGSAKRNCLSFVYVTMICATEHKSEYFSIF